MRAFLLFCSVLIGAAFGAENVVKNIAYLGDDRAEKMDAYLPPENFQRPVSAIVVIHGGSWAAGEKDGFREKNFGEILSAAGYAVFSIDYKLNGGTETEVTSVVWPQNFYDCKTAVRFLRKEAKRFEIDPDKIAVMGSSSGGHLALLTGATANSEQMNRGGLYTDQSNKVSCIIDFYGVCDVRSRRSECFAGKTPEESKANAIAASPLTYFDKNTPPVLLIHGSADPVVPVGWSRLCNDILKEKRIEHQYVEVPGADHWFTLSYPKMDLRGTVLEFLKLHLGEPRKK